MNSVTKLNTPGLRKLKREKTTLSNNGDSDPVHVYCRIRPLKDTSANSSSVKLVAPDTLAIITPELRTIRRETHYKFKHIFTSYSSQYEVFTNVAYPLLGGLLEGHNGLLFTYGVTGSGKTYTLNGTRNDPGIMPRCIDTVFNTIAQCQAPKYVIKSDKMNGFEIQSEEDAFQEQLSSQKHSQRSLRKGDKKLYVNDGMTIKYFNDKSLYTVFISYIEIYNNHVLDLLDESSGKTLQNKILREDSRKNMYVNGVVEVEVKSAEDAFELFNLGQNRKKMASTNLNEGSSRSHSIFNIRVVQVEQGSVNANGQAQIPTENCIRVGQLSLVDLAGSERTNRTNNTGMRLKEASNINNSLMSLRTCLEILRENQINNTNRLVPYRDTRLTFLFKRYFEGDGTVKMIVCLNPSEDDFDENLQVLKFAEMSQDIKIARAEIQKYTPIKKTITRNKENQTPAKKKTRTFTLLPEIPIVQLNLDNIEYCRSAIDKVVKSLSLRKSKSEGLDADIEERHQELRKRLIHINQQSVLSVAEMRSLKGMIHKERQTTQNLQQNINTVEEKNQDLILKNEELKDMIRNLKGKIDQKDLKINQHVLEKERTKQKLVLANEKMTHELDAKLRRQRDHMNAEMRAKEEKLRMVKGIIDSELPPVELSHINLNSTESAIKSVGSATPRPNVHRRNMNVTSANRRRSRSAGETWLEHNVIKPCPLNTVMQPAIKKRKSVSKLDKASDITSPKQSKYCLLAQEPDTDGEMETKLYKADILPTCGGGAQVIFNEVERLRQESPTKE